MKQLRQLISAVTLLILASAAVAQTDQNTNNLITNNPSAWTGIGGHSQLGGVHPITLWGCCTSYSGSMPFFDSSTGSPNGQSGQIIWSFGQATVRQVIGINTALSGTGIQINGYNWGYEVRNMNGNTSQVAYNDVLTATTFLTNNIGTRILSDTRTYTGAQDWNWHGGSVRAASPIELANAGQLGVEFSSRDAGFWGGYYGPQVRNVSLSLNYTVQADPCVTNPQSSPSCPGYKTFHNIPDDGYAIVPIPFGFPLYGQIFTHSLMFDNGVVSFYSPTQPQRFGGQEFYARTLEPNMGSQFHYSIMPLWTDLLNYSGVYYTQQTANSLKYTWENVSQWGHPNRTNTFSLEIRPSGYIGLQYNQINAGDMPVVAGVTGNTLLGEYTLIYSQPQSGFTTNTNLQAWSLNQTVATDCSNPLVNVNCPGYAQAFFNQQCSLNSLYSSSCPGYAQAFLAQQCSINTLYSPSCPGYAVAYYNQQCSITALYHSGCPGYAQAYFDQQCSMNPLYNNQCSGYAQAFFDQQCAINPLYNSGCPGYADAYYVQQCTANPLYDSGCTGYEAAYLAQQCSLNTLYNNSCPGYAQAYFDQQCGLDPLYNNQCPGYATAFYNLQCSVNPLYDTGCPGYAQAFFNQQCSADALYNNQCPGYAEAYALRFIINSPSTTTTTTAVEEPTAITVAVTEEKPVAAAVESAAPAATAKPAEPAAPVQLVAAAPAPAAAQPAAASAPAARTEPAAAPAPRTTRQAMAEQRMAAAREAASKSAQENPGVVTAEVDSAASLEQQVELQNVVLGAMGFVAGFDAYGRVTLPDGVGYAPFVIYPGQRNIDTPAARGLIGRSDRIHEEMVNEQYR